MSTVLIVPGINNSGLGHWQSLWEKANPSFARVQQRDWDHPVCTEWAACLERAVAQAGGDTILVAHSLGCLATVHWAASTGLSVKGALLVAPPDPEGPNFPREASGFAPVPMKCLPFPSVIVASGNDPFASMDYARRCAASWGSELIDIGEAGHINASSGLGSWPQGFALLRSRFPDATAGADAVSEQA